MKNLYYLKLIQDFIIDNQSLSENVKKKFKIIFVAFLLIQKINLYSDFYKNDFSKEYGKKKMNSMKANNYFMNNNSYKNDENTNMLNKKK